MSNNKVIIFSQKKNKVIIFSPKKRSLILFIFLSSKKKNIYISNHSPQGHSNYQKIKTFPSSYMFTLTVHLLIADSRNKQKFITKFYALITLVYKIRKNNQSINGKRRKLRGIRKKEMKRK